MIMRAYLEQQTVLTARKSGRSLIQQRTCVLIASVRACLCVRVYFPQWENPDSGQNNTVCECDCDMCKLLPRRSTQNNISVSNETKTAQHIKRSRLRRENKSEYD